MATRSNIVCVVNRSEAPIGYMFDGIQRMLEPGENHIEESQVEFAKTQNIIMGTEDLSTHEYVSLVGRKGVDDCSPIVFIKDEKRQVHAVFSDGTSMPVGVERIDRRQLGKELQGTIVKNNIPLRRSEVERSTFHDAAAGAIGG